jgi:ABC-2 type transport system ATP-binding protein
MQTKNEPTQTKTPALSVRGLEKSYGRVRALRGIDLEVQPGEIFAFLGPNGAGKTTTIRCLLDMIRPDAGTLRLFGHDPQAEPRVVQALTGYIPGEMQFYENLTARRQLRYFNDLRGGAADWDYVRELADRLALDLEVPIKNLSKGNKQKVAVIQALMHRPRLLILDEPTSGLDPLLQQAVLGMIQQANADGATVFFSSHIISEVERIAGRVAMIRLGEIVETANVQALVNRSLRKLTVRLKQPVNGHELGALPGVEVLARPDERTITLQVAGDMETLVQALGSLPVQDLETSRPSLEEVFLAFYKN